jgi:hypothetical protein
LSWQPHRVHQLLVALEAGLPDDSSAHRQHCLQIWDEFKTRPWSRDTTPVLSQACTPRKIGGWAAREGNHRSSLARSSFSCVTRLHRTVGGRVLPRAVTLVLSFDRAGDAVRQAGDRVEWPVHHFRLFSVATPIDQVLSDLNVTLLGSPSPSP